MKIFTSVICFLFVFSAANSQSWMEVGGSTGVDANSPIEVLCIDNGNNVFAAGSFTNSSGNRYVAQWDGSTWSEVGGLNGLAAIDMIYALCTDASGNVYAAGLFTNGSSRYVAKWDGST